MAAGRGGDKIVFRLLPVPPGEGVCDFCNAPNPEWHYPAREFELTPVELGDRRFEQISDDTGWGVCGACSDLIEAGDETALRLRQLSIMDQMIDKVAPIAPHVPRAVLSKVRADFAEKCAENFRRLTANRTGPRRRFRPDIEV